MTVNKGFYEIVSYINPSKGFEIHNWTVSRVGWRKSKSGTEKTYEKAEFKARMALSK